MYHPGFYPNQPKHKFKQLSLKFSPYEFSIKPHNRIGKKSIFSHIPRPVCSGCFASQKLFSSHKLLQIVEIFWQRHRKLPLSPALPQKCSQFLGRPMSQGYLLYGANTHDFSFSNTKGPQMFCIFVKKTESKSPKTHGQSSLLNRS